MFYLLLIIPHIAAIGGLLMFAFRTDDNDLPGYEGWGDGPGGIEPPTPPLPTPGPSSQGPPLSDAEPPRRRLRPGEQLGDRAPQRPRREHPPVPPHHEPAPVQDGAELLQ